jgi:bacillithiol synthase
MNFTASSIPYQQTGYFSRLVSDYLNGNDFLKNFYELPVSFEGIESAIKNRQAFNTNRQLLSEILEKQYVSLSVPALLKKNLSSLKDKNTFTVTTAHQPAIFTGNLYFIYKIIHVIKIAETLSAKYTDKYFVPVYYMGSEDADIDELGHIYLNNEKIEWDTRQTGSVGRMSVAGLEKIMDRIEGEFAGFPFGPELIALLRESYSAGDTIQQSTLKLINRLFGEYGLIVLIPDSSDLKACMKSVFTDDLLNHTPFQITRKNVENLSAQYNVQANPRAINLFYLKGDIRERIEKIEDHYQVHKTNIRFTRDEILQELEKFPERFSPNVILRGLFQETILPNIAFIGGGGETAYWLELRPLFKHYSVPYPVLVLRNSFLIINKKWKTKIEKAGLSEKSIFLPEEKIVEAQVRRDSQNQLSLEKQIESQRQFYTSLKEITGAIDKTLVQHVNSLEIQSLNKLEELEKKMIRAEKKNHTDVQLKIHEIHSALFPLNNLQERIDNFIPWYASYGEAFLNLIYRHSNNLEQTFTILSETS